MTINREANRLKNPAKARVFARKALSMNESAMRDMAGLSLGVGLAAAQGLRSSLVVATLQRNLRSVNSCSMKGTPCGDGLLKLSYRLVARDGITLGSVILSRHGSAMRHWFVVYP